MASVFDEMSPEEKEALTAEFLLEGEGYLQILNEKLVGAESIAKQGGVPPEDYLHEMFRAAHNIKGMASFVGLVHTTDLTHDMETVLQKLRNKEVRFSVEVVDVLFKAFDAVESEFKSLKATRKEVENLDDAKKALRTVIDGTAVPAAPRAVDKTTVVGKEEEKINLKYLGKFVEDAEQCIDNFNDVLLNFESGKGNAKLINELFRLVHTLKGSAGLIGATRISRVAHSMENIMSYLRETDRTPDENTISILFAGIDAIKDIVSFYRSGQSFEFDVMHICKSLDDVYHDLVGDAKAKAPATDNKQQSDKEVAMNLSEMPQDLKNKCAKAKADGFEVFHVAAYLAEALPMKSLKMLLAEERLKKKGTVLFSAPAAESISDSAGQRVAVSFVFVSLLNEKEIRSALSIDGLEKISIERLEQAVYGETVQAVGPQKDLPQEKMPVTAEVKIEVPIKAADDKADNVKVAGIELSTIRIDSHKLDNLMNLTGELVIVRARFSQLVNMFSKELAVQKDNSHLLSQIKSQNEYLSKEVRTLCGKNGEDDKVASRKINNLLDTINAQLTEMSGRMSKNSIVSMIHSLDEMTSALGKISSDIQTGVMQSRMIPIEGVFTRFKCIVRDLSKTLSKEVELVIEGEDTELDKKIVDSLGDPLTHMIRNAVDHGIETAEERKKSGKPPAATIMLRAAHQGNSILIEIKDDGRGINTDKVIQKALSKGLVTAQQAEKMTEPDKINMIFLPGFSTAEKVTGLSGRGVGLDVVKSMLASVNGLVDVENEIGKGTTFSLRIPLTLAIIKALLVVIGNDTYAFPLESVTEIVKVPTGDIYSIDGSDTIKLRDHALSLVELQDVFGVAKKEGEMSTSKKVVVVTDGNKKIGVIVDSLLGEEEIVIKPLTEHFSRVKGITGASILGDGKIALILDPVAIISGAERKTWG